jgi:hypothetical protein
MTRHNDDDAAPSGASRIDLIEWLPPAVIFVYCAVVAYLCTTFSKAPEIVVGHAMQPRNFPLFLMAVTAVLNVILVFQILRDGNRHRVRQPPQTLITAILMALFWPGAVYVDMFLTLAVIMFLMCIVWGERRLWVAALVAVLTPGVIFFAFDLLLEVRFPRGLLTNLYYG